MFRRDNRLHIIAIHKIRYLKESSYFFIRVRSSNKLAAMLLCKFDSVIYFQNQSRRYIVELSSFYAGIIKSTNINEAILGGDCS